MAVADAAVPLLPSHSGDITGNSSQSKEPSFNKKKTPANSINDAIERYMDASASPSHLLLPALAAFAWIFDAQQAFITIFSDASPPWHCISSACTTSVTPCNFPKSSWSYSLPRQISTISDFSLYCASPVLLGLPASSFFAGCLFGGLLLATIADSQLGRKNTLVLTTLSMSVSSVLTAFSPNFAAYIVFRFVSGFARANISTCAFVLSSELVHRRRRDQISILNFFFYTMGFLSLPAIAFINKTSSWRSLYLCTSIPCFFYSIILHFSMKESHRWLLIKARTEEAIETLKNLTFIEKQSFSDLTEIENVSRNRASPIKNLTFIEKQSFSDLTEIENVAAAAAAENNIFSAARKFLSFGLFGIMICFGGLFAGFLPETKGCGISDTMEEEEIKEIAARNT